MANQVAWQLLMILMVVILSMLGKACGLDYPDYPVIYFPILLPDYYNHTVCIKSCPTNVSWPGEQPASLPCQTNSNVTSCVTNCGNFNFSDY